MAVTIKEKVVQKGVIVHSKQRNYEKTGNEKVVQKRVERQEKTER